jgi:type IV secretion system protein VirB10
VATSSFTDATLEPQPNDTHATVIADPHGSKISPDDPRLRTPRLGGRTLRMGPAVAVGAGLLTALTGAVAVALQPAAPSQAKADTEPAPSLQAPVIPETIRNPAPPPPSLPPVAALDAGPPPMPAQVAAGGPGSPLERQRDTLAQARAEQDAKAFGASILFDTRSSAPAAPAGSPSLPSLAGGPLGAAPAGSSQADDDPNKQSRKNSFLDSEGSGDSLESTLHHPASPNEIQAGTIIPAVLLTAINSDIPGPVIAQVREHVYDTVTGNTLLIPQGSRLMANYDSMVTWGQQRILVCWRRLLFPNGDSLDLKCAPAADLAGAAGLTDQVDEHWVRLLLGAGISSLLAATSQAAAGNQTGFAPTVPQLWASNGAQSVNQSGQQIVRRDLQIQPTITVRPGFSVNVIINKDFALPPYRDTTTLSAAPDAPR